MGTTNQEFIQPATQAVESNAPKNLSELATYLEGREKEIQETGYILAMSAQDLMKMAEGVNSARKLRKLLNNVLLKNIEINRKVSSYALEAITITKNTINVIDSNKAKLTSDRVERTKSDSDL